MLPETCFPACTHFPPAPFSNLDGSALLISGWLTELRTHTRLRLFFFRLLATAKLLAYLTRPRQRRNYEKRRDDERGCCLVVPDWQTLALQSRSLALNPLQFFVLFLVFHVSLVFLFHLKGFPVLFFCFLMVAFSFFLARSSLSLTLLLCVFCFYQM